MQASLERQANVRKSPLQITWLVAVILATLLVSSSQTVAWGESCGISKKLAGLFGSGDVALLKLQQASNCQQARTTTVHKAQPYFTYQVACSPNRGFLADGFCSTTPCVGGRSYAFRTLHNPDGTQAAAGFACVSLNQAAVVPGITAAEVFAAVRRVKLPGGAIRATPGARGLANLRSFFFLEGAAQPPVDLTVRGSTVRARFEVVEYRWSFGDGQALVTAGPGTPGQDSEVHAIYRRRGRYAVSVEVAWRAEAFLGGNRVGEVDGLASSSQVAYPVAELQTVLTG
jgi:hypothetical protein